MTSLAFPHPNRRFATWLLVSGLCSLALPSPAQCEPSTTPTAAEGSDQAFQVTVEVMEVDPDSGKQTSLDLHLVLFVDGKSYDFALTQPRDVTVLDPVAGKITLLSREKHVKTTLATEDLVTTAVRVRQYAKNEGIEERLGIGAKVTRQGNQFAVGYAGFRYDVATAGPQSATQPAKFAEFTNWVARLNLIRKLGTPPFARMELGRSIAAAGRLPETVTLRLGSDGQQRTLLSKYRFERGLSDAAAKRIDEVAGMTTLYREVALGAFPK